MPSVRSVALGFWIGTGSRNETPEQAGISHFLEHLLFKGTNRFSSTEIDEIFDGMGAEINAGTGKETTSVYARFLDRHLERAFEVISSVPVDTIAAYHDARYVGRNLVVAAAGNLDHDRIVSLVEQAAGLTA